MIKTERLEHAPETMTEMDRKSNKRKDVEKGVEKSTQKFFYRNGYRNVFWRKGEAKEVNNKKEQYDQTGVRHGFRCKRVFDNSCIHSVSGTAGLTVLIEEEEPNSYMYKEN